MSERELVDAFLGGKITSWTFVRGLMKKGLSVGTAIAFTTLLPATAQGRDAASLELFIAKTSARSPDEAAVLERLTQDVLESLVKIDAGGRPAHLRRALAKLSLNLANTNANDNTADLAFNGEVRSVPVNVSGNFNAVDQNVNDNFALNLAGTVGEVPINLNGFVTVNETHGPNAVNVNVSGNVGQVPISFNQPRDRD